MKLPKVTFKNSIFKNLAMTLRAGSSLLSSLGLSPIFSTKAVFRGSLEFWKLALLACALVAVGCSSQRALAGSSARIFYSDARSVPLIPPWENTLFTEENQHLSGTFGDRNFSGESWMLLSDSTIHVMLFGNIGNTLAELVYTKDSVSFESSVMDVKKVKPEYILADIQFCYYPKEVLERNFSAAGFSFVEERRGKVLTRKLLENGTTILRMERTANRIFLKNELRDYSYSIEFENLP